MIIFNRPLFALALLVAAIVYWLCVASSGYLVAAFLAFLALNGFMGAVLLVEVLLEVIRRRCRRTREKCQTNHITNGAP